MVYRISTIVERGDPFLLKNKNMKNTNTKETRATNKVVRSMLKDLNLSRITYYSDLTNPTKSNKRRKIFKFGYGEQEQYTIGLDYMSPIEVLGSGVVQYTRNIQLLTLDQVAPIISYLNENEGEGWVPWKPHNKFGKDYCLGIYKYTQD